MVPPRPCIRTRHLSGTGCDVVGRPDPNASWSRTRLRLVRIDPGLGVAVAGQSWGEPRPSDQTAPASQALARPVGVVAGEPSIDLPISLVPGAAVALLDTPSELIAAASRLVEVIVSEISPLLLDLSLEL